MSEAVSAALLLINFSGSRSNGPKFNNQYLHLLIDFIKKHKKLFLYQIVLNQQGTTEYAFSSCLAS
jgi:hypothetical protein